MYTENRRTHKLPKQTGRYVPQKGRINYSHIDTTITDGIHFYTTGHVHGYMQITNIFQVFHLSEAAPL
jgi:hypothetical protein